MPPSRQGGLDRIARLLIANRGEIAVRIARSAHRLGIDTVGVYSEPDVDALHVDAVDVAVALGGHSPAESYLRAEALVEAARSTGCDAVHPGYGFLAENAAFAQAVLDAGLLWVGPTPSQIRLLGDKVAAKRAAIAAGVPTTAVVEISPGDPPPNVPLPALVKAAAGGGGRGMRVVRTAAELPAALEAATREAAAAFGDGTVFVEPYIERGRHVEVQVLGDVFGNVVHLGERDCSIQRRNQKIVEESPAPGLTEDTRRSLCDGALALARHVGYQNAGTVEFLVGPDGTITFLEVNTRLQVEHPVTEAVTGIDLVEQQLRVAAGEPLRFTQDDVTVTGHAIEVRIVAEDPAAGWLPSTGTVEALSLDDGGVRIDAGVRIGTAIGTEYDSLLAKVIAHGPTRTSAARRLARALRSAEIDGVLTNCDTLVAILTDGYFLAGAVTTRFLEDHPGLAEAALPAGDDELAHLLAAVLATEAEARRADTVTGFAPAGWRNLRTQGQRSRWRRGSRVYAVEHTPTAAGIDALVGAWPEPGPDGVLGPDDRRAVQVRVIDSSPAHQTLELDRRRHRIETAIGGGGLRTRSRFGSAVWEPEPRFADHDTEEVGSGPVSPLPGTVIAVHTEAGREVADGDLLVVIEAMKMEHRIHAVGAATVLAVHVGVGDRVDAGDLLVSIEAHAPAGAG